MNDEPVPAATPAALPLTLFTAALAAAPLLTGGRLLHYGFLLCALLVAATPLPRRISILFACVALGFFVAFEHQAAAQRARGVLENLSAERFVTVEAPIVRDWRPTSFEGSMLRTRDFTVSRGIENHELDEGLLIFLPGSPPPFSDESVIRAEGFLRRSEYGGYSLHVKSPRLISYRGRLSWWDPALWNRILSRRLTPFAGQRPREIALIQAVALGRSESLPDELRQDYLRGGIYHLLVFSGMQIAIAAAAVGILLRMAGAGLIADWMLLLLSVLAPRFAGDEPSVARASWMIGLYALSRLLRRPTSIENLLFVSALIRLAAYPEELTDPGFALTYGATAGLILVGKPLADLFSNRVLRAAAYSAGAEIGTTSLTLFFFNHYVIGGSILTLLVGPLITLMLASSIAALIALWIHPAAFDPVLSVIALLDDATSRASGFFGSDAGLCGLAAAPPAWSVIASAFALLAVVALFRRKFLAMRIAILLFPALLSIVMAKSEETVAGARVEILDVGQGDAILLRSGDGSVLVDSGGRAGDARFGRNVLVPMLLDRGVRRLDAVAISHPDPDHCGGMSSVVEHLAVGELWISRRHLEHPCAADLVERAEQRGTLVIFVDSARLIEWSGMAFRPIIPRLRFKRSPVNNSSVVFHVTLGEHSLLLTGDIEKDAEKLLSEEESPRLRAEILKVAHHGSRSSSTGPFLEAVSPRMAVISSGRNNRFGHPHDDVVGRLRETTPVIRGTHRSGSIRIDFEAGRAFLSTEIDTPR